MAHGPRYKVPFRRRRKGKTDYHQRFNIIRGGWLRFVVRRSQKHTLCQVVEAKREGDYTKVSSHSKELEQYGWNVATSNIPAAYLTGYLCGLRARKKGIKKAVLDLGLERVVKGSRIFAALAGAHDAGLDIPLNEEVLPPEERKKGAVIGVEKLVDTVQKNIEEAIQ